VEWLDDQKRRLLTQTSSTCPIVEAQPFAPKEPHKGRKRKRHFEQPLTTDSSNPQDATTTREDQDESVQFEIDNKVIAQEREHSPSGRQTSYPNEETDKEAKTDMGEAHPTDDRHDGSSTGEPRFFLVKPRTTSSRHVLIPLAPTATLGECLVGRTVLEFPTIYVFPGSVEQLPEEFMLEQDYLKQEGEEQKEFDALIKELDPEVLKRLKDDGQQHGHRMGNEERVDDKEILDVLKKDFGTLL